MDGLTDSTNTVRLTSSNTQPLLSIDMPRHMMASLRWQAFVEKRTMSALVCEVVKKYLDERLP